MNDSQDSGFRGSRGKERLLALREHAFDAAARPPELMSDDELALALGAIGAYLSALGALFDERRDALGASDELPF